MKRVFITGIVLSLILCGCSKEESVTPKTDVSVDSMFTDRDYRETYDEEDCVVINLEASTASCESNSVKISDGTITITQEGTYILSGKMDDGMIIVDVDKKDKVQIVLNGATINSKESAALYVLEADKVFVTLEDGTQNTFSNGGTFEAIDENNIDGTIFSKQDITFNGNGKLTIESPAGHGIVAKDDLVITNGTYDITSLAHGMDVNDSVKIDEADIKIASGKDGIHVENEDDATLGYIYVLSANMDISSDGDGISAEAYMQIENGTFNIVSGGGSANSSTHTSDSWSAYMGARQKGEKFANHIGEITTTEETETTSVKGMSVSGKIIINDGTFTIDSADDSIHSNTAITVNGGNFELASGDDAFHADENLTINDCIIDITKSYEGLEALNIEINGGDISLVAKDDGINAAGGNDNSGNEGPRGMDMFGKGQNTSSNGIIEINGGTIYVEASGDGIDANGSFTINGGDISICGPNQGDTATLDYDKEGVITGGTFIGTGASGMAQTFSDSSQGVISASVGNQSKGCTVTVEDSEGNVIATCTPNLDFSIVIVSTPDMKSGETYTLTAGTSTGEVVAK